YFIVPATPKSSTLSLHDALPISASRSTSAARSSGRSPASTPPALPIGDRTASTINAPLTPRPPLDARPAWRTPLRRRPRRAGERSEEHTSELQSRSDLVCRLLLE